MDILLERYTISRFAPDFSDENLVESCVDAYAHHDAVDYAALDSTG